MKYIFLILVLIFFGPPLIAPASAADSAIADCQSLHYAAEDYEYLADFENSLEKTCQAAERSAQWQACVICAGDERRNQLCQVLQIKSLPNEATKTCAAEVKVISENCAGHIRGGSEKSASSRQNKNPLVHCGRITAENSPTQ